MPRLATGRILAVDVGATTIKLCEVRGDGTLVDAPDQRRTPYPCAPGRLVDFLAAEIRARQRNLVAVGFPGDFRDGCVIEPGNLSRSGGITTDVDAALHDEWLNFPLEESLGRASGCEVRVVNDATLAALGCYEGVGRELVLTLGTGLGIALVVDGVPERIRDVGSEVFVDARTYDQVFGEPARAADPDRWATQLCVAVHGFVAEFAATTVHFGGGNARRVDAAWFHFLGAHVVLHDNDASLRGAARLFALQ
ncbi:MAG TPA: ROK family protein [Acidimicrobiales bacterium]|nr:ROK family protein [Acidimicrobiales bacterium]